MDKERIIDNKVMGIHLNNIQTMIERAIFYNNATASDKTGITTKTFMVRDSLKSIKEQILMAELYIESDDD